MKTGHPGAGPYSSFRWSRIYAAAALALALILAVVFTTALFTTDISRADGPPNLGADFSLPIKLEQGRPAPARSPSGPRQPGATPAFLPTAEPPSLETVDPQVATPEPDLQTMESNNKLKPPAISARSFGGAPKVRIEWTRPRGNVDGYQIQVSSDRVFWRLLSSPAAQSTHSFDQGMDWNETRHYRIRARNGDVWSDWSNSTSANAARYFPDPLSAEALSTTSIKISWEGYGAGSPVTGWVLQVSEDSGDDKTWETLADGLAAEERTFTHQGLTAGATRYYRIGHKNQAGLAPWSNTVVRGTTFHNSVPSPPSLSARADGALTILLSWTKPSGQGFPITGYDLQDSVDGQVWRNSVSIESHSTNWSFDVGEPGATRYFRMRARNTQGLGPWSGAIHGVADKGRTDSPTRLSVTDSRGDRVELEWSAAQPGDSPVTGYQVQRRLADSEDNWQNVGSVGPSVLTFRDTGVKPATRYYYRVATSDKRGLGPWSPSREVRTNSLAPNAPRLTLRAGCQQGSYAGEDYPTDPCVSAPAPGQTRSHVWIEVTWADTQNNGAIIAGYRLERSPNGKDNWEYLSLGSLGGHEGGGYGEDYDVGYGETWYYRVRSTWEDVVWDPTLSNRQGEDVGRYSPWSTVVSATTMAFVPGVMPYLKKGPVLEKQIQVTWVPLSDDGGLPVTGYQIQVSTQGSGPEANWSTLATLGKDSRGYTHSDLRGDTEYCYRSRAGNSLGWSNWGIPMQFAAQCFRLTPAAPVITVEPTGGTAVRVSWTKPDSLGLTLTGYELGISSSPVLWNLYPNFNYGLGVEAVLPSYDSIRKEYLRNKNAESALFRVRARTLEGVKGEWSEVEEISVIVPEAPTITVSTITSGANVNWSEPNSRGLMLAGYQFGMSPNGTSWPGHLKYSYGTARNSAHVAYSALRNTYLGQDATEVYFRVRAMATDGRPGDWSEVVRATIPPP